MTAQDTGAVSPNGAPTIADLELARAEMITTVLAIRERHEDRADGLGQRLLSAAIQDLESMDARLDQLRGTLD